eukprot:15439378-Alexandrium_andersonii.AAC.1
MSIYASLLLCVSASVHLCMRAVWASQFQSRAPKALLERHLVLQGEDRLSVPPFKCPPPLAALAGHRAALIAGGEGCLPPLPPDGEGT